MKSRYEVSHVVTFPCNYFFVGSLFTWHNSITILQTLVNSKVLTTLNNIGNMSDRDFEETLAAMPNVATTDASITPVSSSAKHPSVKKCEGSSVTYTLMNDGEESNSNAPLLPGN